MKTILVTGGAGFIGSHLCRTLLKRNNRVICLDNFRTGNPRNIEDLMKDPNFSLRQADVTEPFDADADEIYHLACPASPNAFQEDPVATAKICFIGALNVLELARKKQIPVLLSSTSEVYGDPKVHPQKETYWGNVNPIGRRACYDEGKRIAEALFFDANRFWKLPVRIVRLFNTYGPFMDPGDGRVVPNFIMQALHGEDITVYGDGLQTRSFCYVEDTVEGMVRMMDQEDRLGRAFIGPVNIGNPVEQTVLSLAEEILKLTDSPSRIVFCDLPEDDPVRRRPDITRAKGILRWEPRVSLEEGLKRTIQYFREKEDASGGR